MFKVNGKFSIEILGDISLLICNKFATILSDVIIPFSLLAVGSSYSSFSEIMLINKTKKDTSLCLLLELSRNYDGRIVIDVTRTASIHRNGGPPRSLEMGLLDTSQRKKNWNFLTSISRLGL